MPDSSQPPSSICLFGGSFDPVHDGHLHIAREAVEICQLDKLIFIPCSQSPHKFSQTRASGNQRMEMLKLATQQFTWADTDSLELERPSPSYSWQTVSTYREHYPDAQLYWLLGTDQWNALDKWANYDFLVNELTFIIYTRGDDILTKRSGISHQVLSGSHPASSTQIRELLFQTKNAQWLADEVIDYIVTHQLYVTA